MKRNLKNKVLSDVTIINRLLQLIRLELQYVAFAVSELEISVLYKLWLIQCDLSRCDLNQ